MSTKSQSSKKAAKVVAENPLILRCHRIMEAFAKSDDERDFYLDRQEGFLIYIDLDKSQEEIDELLKELASNPDRYCAIPKLTFYEIKKVMEGFVNEKIYDIDTKEKLLDIISSKEAKDNFLEFIYDHHSELEKWQQYYQERFRVRIIEWLRNNQFDFVFEEDLELTKSMVERLKLNLFTAKVGKDVISQRKVLVAKAKTYYSSEALNPRPKRGRPPKQVVKVETEPQFSQDVYLTIPKVIKPFLFAPEYHGSSAIFTFSGKFSSEEDLLAHRRQQLTSGSGFDLQNLQQKLAALRTISGGWDASHGERKPSSFHQEPEYSSSSRSENRQQEQSFFSEEDDVWGDLNGQPARAVSKKSIEKKAIAKKVVVKKSTPAKSQPVRAKTVKLPSKTAAKVSANASTKSVAKLIPAKKASPTKKSAVQKSSAKKPVAKVKSVSKAVSSGKNGVVKKSAAKSSTKLVVKKVAKPPAKVRLRTISKPVKSASAKKENPQPKSSSMRLLRRAKKK